MKKVKIQQGSGLESEPLIFEKSSIGRCGVEPAVCDVPDVNPKDVIDSEYLRTDIPGFPEVSEGECVRHFTLLSMRNFGVDSGFYPLGSCTMKYNPKVNEVVSRYPGFALLHPYAPEELCQGALELIYTLEAELCDISGMSAVTLQPAAGAQGELCGMLMIKDYFADRGEVRGKVIIPDTAHGTNPSSCNVAGFDVVRVKSGPGGVLLSGDVEKLMDEGTAALMLTNPNTLGLFERNIKEIADVVHKKGGLVYCDGANMNALMGLSRVGDMGVDLIQMNLHKTFSTPHGGGGPGSGPLGVKKELTPYLPVPRITKDGDVYRFECESESTIGRMKAFYGHFGVMVKAYAYIRRMGAEGLRRVSEIAILNANYVKEQLKNDFYLPYPGTCMHECVFTDKLQGEYSITTLDIAKRLMDFGYHPPTIYFPLVVGGAMMVEPTETESLKTLDGFIDAMRAIATEARETPEVLKNAPFSTPVSRVDETRAARQPVLKWVKQ